MKSKHQLAVRVSTFTGWKRWTAILCVLLTALASYVQASHNHGAKRSSNKVAVRADASVHGDAGTDSDCPICAAMSGAAPSLEWAPQTFELVETVSSISSPVDRVHESLWRYAMFGRPPPTAS